MANQYFTCVLDAWRDGRTLYGRMHYYRNGSYYYQDSSFPNPTMNLGGTVFTDTDFGNRVRSGIYVGDVYSTTFSRTVAGGGDRTVTWSAGSGVRSDFAGSWSATVWFPEPYTDPSGLSVSVAERYTDGFKFNVSLSSYGNPSGADGRYIEAGIMAQNSYGGIYRYQIATNTNSASIIVNNSSRTGSTPLTINPNTMYYVGGYATNTQRNISTVIGGYTTLAPAPTLSVSSVTDKTATITYSTQADGGKYGKNIQYSLDNGTTWVTGATVNTGSATTGSFTIPNLTENTHYTVKSRVSTSAGTTNGNDFSFTTKVSEKFYGSANGRTELIEKFYGSVDGQTEEIIKMYGPVPMPILIGLTGEIDAGGVGNITAFDPAPLRAIINSDTAKREELGKKGFTFNDLTKLMLYYSDEDNDPYWVAALLFGSDDPEVAWLWYLSDTDNPYTLAELGITANLATVGEDSITLTPVNKNNYISKLVYQKQND